MEHIVPILAVLAAAIVLILFIRSKTRARKGGAPGGSVGGGRDTNAH